jgi:hypothetical protein
MGEPSYDVSAYLRLATDDDIEVSEPRELRPVHGVDPSKRTDTPGESTD